MILVAGGQGTRLGHDLPKALVPLRGVPLVRRAAAVASSIPSVSALVVVAPEAAVAEVTELLGDLAGDSHEGSSAPAPERGVRQTPVSLTVVAGGAERQDSVRHGLAALDPTVDLVLVHDAARPLAGPEVFDRVIAALSAGVDAAIPALPVVDTIKEVDTTGAVVRTPDRSALRAVQTPQGFRRLALDEAHLAAATAPGPTATDDAALIERRGGRVVIVPGESRAEKITTAEDLHRAERRLAAQGAGSVLLVVCGLPGVGKSTVARVWAQETGAAHIRVDSIEQALVASRAAESPDAVGVSGYAVAHAVAADQLAAGNSVVIDAVDPTAASRRGWADLAARFGSRLVRVVLQCPAPERRRRLAQREVAGTAVPSAARAAGVDVEPYDVEPYGEESWRIDTHGYPADHLVVVLHGILAADETGTGEPGAGGRR